MTKAEELESVLNIVRATMANCQRQNEKLIKMARFYGDPAVYRYSDTRKCWRPIDEDQGARAREILAEVGL